MSLVVCLHFAVDSPSLRFTIRTVAHTNKRIVLRKTNMPIVEAATASAAAADVVGAHATRRFFSIRYTYTRTHFYSFAAGDVSAVVFANGSS